MKNLKLVRDLYDALARRDERAIAAALSSDVVWIQSYEDGRYEGPDAVLAYVVAPLNEKWDSWRTHVHEWIDAGRTIIAIGEHAGTYRSTGRAMQAAFAHVHDLRRGKIVRFRQYADTAHMAEAMQLNADAASQETRTEVAREAVIESPSAAGDVVRFLRHTVATLAYRAARVIADPPHDFATTCAGVECRSAIEVLAHVGDLMESAAAKANNEDRWNESSPRSWREEVTRFYAAIARLDEVLATASEDDRPIGCSPERLFQGPIADALTHVGQLATLRRLAGAPIRSENYFQADVSAGRVGSDQSKERAEFG